MDVTAQQQFQLEAGRIAAHYYGQMLAKRPGATLDGFRDHIAERYGAENWAKLPQEQRADAIAWVTRGKAASR